MYDFEALAVLVEVAENLIPFNRIPGIRNCRIDDECTLFAVATGTCMAD